MYFIRFFLNWGGKGKDSFFFIKYNCIYLDVSIEEIK